MCGLINFAGDAGYGKSPKNDRKKAQQQWL
jgi:hypothetical protein